MPLTLNSTARSAGRIANLGMAFLIPSKLMLSRLLSGSRRPTEGLQDGVLKFGQTTAFKSGNGESVARMTGRDP
jgi:hypothetical protein